MTELSNEESGESTVGHGGGLAGLPGLLIASDTLCWQPFVSRERRLWKYCDTVPALVVWMTSHSGALVASQLQSDTRHGDNPSLW